MNLSWTNLKKVMGELTTSNKLGQAEAKLITDSVEADAQAGAVADAGEAAPTPVAVAAPVPAPVVAPAPSAPVAVAAPAVPVAVSSENEELVRLRAENAQLKAKVTPGLAAAVPTEDATQTASGKGASATEENKHFARLERIKKTYGKFNLTAEIDLGEAE